MYLKILSIIDDINLDVDTGIITTAKGGNGTVDKNTGYLVFKKNGMKFQLHQILAVLHFKRGCIGMTVNHIDGNKLNNNKENLELMTLSENVKHEHETGLANYLKTEDVKTSIPVICLNKITNKITLYGSIKRASKSESVPIETIRRRLTGVRNTFDKSDIIWI